jgi:hypothetical protein
MLKLIKIGKPFLLSLTALALMMAGCREREQVDITPPEIEEIQMNGATVTAIQIEQGTSTTISVHATDNKDLEKITLSLISDENAATPPTGVYDFTSTEMVTGEHAMVSFDLVIPNSIAGTQILRVKAVDANGYIDFLDIPFIIINSQAPSITGSTNPAANSNNEVLLEVDQNLLVSGEANDSDGLATFKVMLWDANDVVISTTDIPIINTPMAFSDASFDQAVAGQYRVVIEAIDNTGHRSLWGRFVIVD